MPRNSRGRGQDRDASGGSMQWRRREELAIGASGRPSQRGPACAVAPDQPALADAEVDSSDGNAAGSEAADAVNAVFPLLRSRSPAPAVQAAESTAEDSSCNLMARLK